MILPYGSEYVLTISSSIGWLVGRLVERPGAVGAADPAAAEVQGEAQLLCSLRIGLLAATALHDRGCLPSSYHLESTDTAQHLAGVDYDTAWRCCSAAAEERTESLVWKQYASIAEGSLVIPHTTSTTTTTTSACACSCHDHLRCV